MLLYEKDLDVVLQEIMTRWDIPGLAVGMARGDGCLESERPTLCGVGESAPSGVPTGEVKADVTFKKP